MGQTQVGDPDVSAGNDRVVAIAVSVYNEVFSECIRSHEWTEFLSNTHLRPLPQDQLPQEYYYEKVLLAIPPAATEVRRLTHPNAIRTDNPGGDVQMFIYGGDRIIADRFDYNTLQRDDPQAYLLWHGVEPPVENIRNQEFLNYLKIKIAIRALPASEVNASSYFERLQAQAAEAFAKAREYDERFESVGFASDRDFPNRRSYEQFYGGSDIRGGYGRDYF